MTRRFSYKCVLPNGIHGRPANSLQELASQFHSQFTLLNRRNGKIANAKSVLSLVSADVKDQDTFEFTIEGADEDQAAQSLLKFLAEDFPLSDQTMPDTEAKAQFILPPALEQAGVKCVQATSAVPGIGKGKVAIAAGLQLPAEHARQKAAEPAQEKGKIVNAIAAVRKRLKSQSLRAGTKEQADILNTHLALLEDVELRDYTNGLIDRKKLAAGPAVIEAAKHFSEILANSETLLLRERVLDIQDVCAQLVNELYGIEHRPLKLHEPTVLVGEYLRPSQLLWLDKTMLKGLVIGHAGTTSHTVILARSFEIPTVTGVKDAHTSLKSGQEVVLDARNGILITQMNQHVKRYYQQEKHKYTQLQAQLAKHIEGPAKTDDGRQIDVGANISSLDEVAAAMEHGAQEIGLFRTEMIFMDRQHAPTEDEQFEIYSQAAIAAKGKPLVIRTFDIGGDKPVEYLQLPHEENPFLGYRAVRLYRQFTELFMTQLRAVIRATRFGDVRLLIPMISCLEEIRWVKDCIAKIKTQLDREQIPYEPNMKIGIMIEVPSTAFIIDQLGKQVDFLSIGTNDLAQYFMAADRSDKRLDHLYNPLHPGFLRMLKQIVTQGHKANCHVGMCGEMAGKKEYLPILLGLNLDGISLSLPNIPAVKAEIAQLNHSQCTEFTAGIENRTTAEDIEQALEDFRFERFKNLPLMDQQLIILNSQCKTKAELIKEAADTLFVAGRCDNPEQLELAVWQREKVCSTHVGYELAVPHCKSDYIYASSVCLIKLQQPIEWNPEEHQPVSTAICLVIREVQSEDHLAIFSRLARLLVHEHFRNFIKQSDDKAAILDFVLSALR